MEVSGWMGARNEHEIQMQASNHRSLWSAEASVQRSNQDGSLASEALRELKRAGAELWVVRESSTFSFLTHPPANQHGFSTMDGQTEGKRTQQWSISRDFLDRMGR